VNVMEVSKRLEGSVWQEGHESVLSAEARGAMTQTGTTLQTRATALRTPYYSCSVCMYLGHFKGFLPAGDIITQNGAKWLVTPGGIISQP
jgi:hypothetical protein